MVWPLLEDALDRRERRRAIPEVIQGLGQQGVGILDVRGRVAGVARQDPLQLDRGRVVVWSGACAVSPRPAAAAPRLISGM
jgi:hypothetical protein